MLKHTILLAAVAGLVFVLVPAVPSFAFIVTDYSNFNESGNLCPDWGDIEQSFTPTGPSVVIAYVSGTGCGMECYTSNEFGVIPVGGRWSVDLTSIDIPDQQNLGLCISTNAPIGMIPWSTEMRSYVHLLVVPDDRFPFGNQPHMMLEVFGSDGARGEARYDVPIAQGDTIFIERASSTGWTFGYIHEGTETKLVEDLSTLGGVPLIDVANYIGFKSEKHHTDTPARTLSNLTYVPEPATMGLLVLGGLGMLIRRRRK